MRLEFLWWKLIRIELCGWKNSLVVGVDLENYFWGGGCLNIIIFRGVVVWNFFFDFLELCRKFLLMGEK